MINYSCHVDLKQITAVINVLDFFYSEKEKAVSKNEFPSLSQEALSYRILYSLRSENH